MVTVTDIENELARREVAKAQRMSATLGEPSIGEALLIGTGRGFQNPIVTGKHH